MHIPLYDTRTKFKNMLFIIKKEHDVFHKTWIYNIALYENDLSRCINPRYKSIFKIYTEKKN